jgi:hypothetical protein
VAASVSRKPLGLVTQHTLSSVLQSQAARRRVPQRQWRPLSPRNPRPGYPKNPSPRNAAHPIISLAIPGRVRRRAPRRRWRPWSAGSWSWPTSGTRAPTWTRGRRWCRCVALKDRLVLCSSSRGACAGGLLHERQARAMLRFDGRTARHAVPSDDDPQAVFPPQALSFKVHEQLVAGQRLGSIPQCLGFSDFEWTPGIMA